MRPDLREVLARIGSRQADLSAPPPAPPPNVRRDSAGRVWVEVESPSVRRWGFPADVDEVTPVRPGPVRSAAFRELGWTGKELVAPPLAHISGPRDRALALALWFVAELAKRPEARPLRFVSARTFGDGWADAPALPPWQTLVVGDVLASLGAPRIQQATGLVGGRGGRTVLVVGDAEIAGDSGLKLAALLDYDGARKVAA